MKIKIESDVYNISKRIKNIDKGYYVVFNTSTNKFEIHNEHQAGSSYCLTLPFTQLDERTINFIEETKSENIEKILSKIENENSIRESADKSSTLSDIYYDLQDKEIKWKL